MVWYNEGFDLARQLGYLLDLEQNNPLSISISEGDLTQKVVSLAGLLGMVEGLITIDGQAPGDNNGLVVCARLPEDFGVGEDDARRTRTCVDLEADGSFQVVLPTPGFGEFSGGRIAVCVIDQIDLCLPLDSSEVRRPEGLNLLNFDTGFEGGKFIDVGVHDIR